MIEKILDLSVRNRWFIVLVTAVACALGVWSLNKLPIDAVPDVTNNQVQINAIAPALTPIEMEKQVTFQIENILAGTPTLEYTRSFSRNGFAQVTAVFSDKTSIYFARQQVNERLQEIRRSLPPEAEVRLGPISTGLGEVYWWAVEYQKPPKDAPVADGKPGWQTAAISRRKAGTCAPISSARSTCARCRTGLSARRCGRCRVSPAPTPSAAMSSSI